MLVRLLLILLTILHSTISWSQSFNWVSQYGGEHSDYPYGIAKDSDDNLIVVGTFSDSGDFNPSPSIVTSLKSNGGTDIFIVKSNDKGILIWAKSIGGGSSDFAFDVLVDSLKSVYVTGYFQNTVDFDPNPSSTFNLVSRGNQDLYILKLDSSGNFIWANSIGWNSIDYGSSIALDEQLNVYVTGKHSHPFTFQRSPYSDAFIARFNANGTHAWTKIIEGENETDGISMEFIQGKLFLSGSFSDTVDFDPSTSTDELIANRQQDAFIAIFDTSGNFIEVKQLQGSGTEYIYDVKQNLYGDIIIVGTYSDTAFFSFDTTNLKLVSSNLQDGFIWSVDTNFKTNWIRTQYGQGNQICKTVSTVDSFIYVGGSYMSQSFFVSDSSASLTSKGGSDGIITLYDNEGILRSSATVSGINHERIELVVASHNHEVFHSGYFWGPTNFQFDSANGSYTSRGSFNLTDVFLGSYTLCPNSYDSLFLISCDSFKSPSGKHVFYSTGFYRDTLINSKGCDSVLNITLEVNSSTLDTISIRQCYNFSAPSGKSVWTNSGIYIDSLLRLNNCDSILVFDLTIDTSTYSSIQDTACEFYILPSGRQISSSGNYTDTITNQNGCDSIISTQLEILNNTFDTLKLKACKSFTSPSGQIFTKDSLFGDTIPNNHGCDSVIQIDLKIGYPSKTILYPRECHEYFSPSNKRYTSTGFFLDTLVSRYGCDSVFEIHLIIDSSDFDTKNIQRCEEFITVSGKVITTSSVVYDTIINSRGCDSIIEYNVDIISIDAQIIQRNDSLIATEEADVYQWYECLAPPRRRHIQWVVSNVLKPVNSGFYSVELYKKNCFKASECVQFQSVGINNKQGLTPIVFPNPFDGFINISTSFSADLVEFRLVNSLGETVINLLVNPIDKVELPEHIPSGVYYLELRVGNKVMSINKMIKI